MRDELAIQVQEVARQVTGHKRDQDEQGQVIRELASQVEGQRAQIRDLRERLQHSVNASSWAAKDCLRRVEKLEGTLAADYAKRLSEMKLKMVRLETLNEERVRVGDQTGQHRLIGALESSRDDKKEEKSALMAALSNNKQLIALLIALTAIASTVVQWLTK